MDLHVTGGMDLDTEESVYIVQYTIYMHILNLLPVSTTPAIKLFGRISACLHLKINFLKTSFYKCTAYCQPIASKQNMENFLSQIVLIITGVVDIGD